MPASRIVFTLTILAMLATPNILLHTYSTTTRTFPTQSPAVLSGSQAAVRWLDNQSSDGTYGGLPHIAAAAAYALWLSEPHSSKPALIYSWLGTQLDNATNWFWGPYGEYDIPGVALYSIAATENFQAIQKSNVTASFLDYQQPNGGFLGYWPTGASSPNTSSVDTAEAVRGLASAGFIDAAGLLPAVEYLFSLQNKDGSFNLTNTIAYDPVYSQGPEPVSITALVLLALNDAHYPSSNLHVVNALGYLTTKSSYTGAANDTGAVYSASLTALALNAYGRTDQAASAISFILRHQSSDGGFRDSIRTSQGSNALDTAWAAIALHIVTPPVLSSPLLPTVVFYGLIAGTVALALVGIVVVFLVRRTRAKEQSTVP